MNVLQTYMEKTNQATLPCLDKVSDEQCFDLMVLINNFCIWYEQVLAEKNLQLTTKISASIPKMWLGDRLLVKYIFSETGNNSLKYLGTGEVFLEVEAEQLAGRRYAIHFTITHSGDTIPLTKEKEFFQPFAAQRDKNGFKLRSTNLYYARMTARTLGGDIRIENRPGFGTRYLAGISLLTTAT